MGEKVTVKRQAAAIDVRDATDAILNGMKIDIHIEIMTIAAGVLTAINTPREVATPFPPLNFAHTGKMCPATAAIPVSIEIQESSE